MKQEEFIELAKEAGLSDLIDYNRRMHPDCFVGKWDDLIKLCKLIAEKSRFEAADDAWIELVKHGIGWELRKAVTDAIHARDEA